MSQLTYHISLKIRPKRHLSWKILCTFLAFDLCRIWIWLIFQSNDVKLLHRTVTVVISSVRRLQKERQLLASEGVVWVGFPWSVGIFSLHLSTPLHKTSFLHTHWYVYCLEQLAKSALSPRTAEPHLRDTIRVVGLCLSITCTTHNPPPTAEHLHK